LHYRRQKKINRQDFILFNVFQWHISSIDQVLRSFLQIHHQAIVYWNHLWKGNRWIKWRDQDLGPIFIFNFKFKHWTSLHYPRWYNKTFSWSKLQRQGENWNFWQYHRKADTERISKHNFRLWKCNERLRLDQLDRRQKD
jgi:hypothetical protein